MAWNGLERRKEQKDFKGKEKRTNHIGKNYRESAQLYQMEQAVRVMFLPDYNVWQVHKMDYPSYAQRRWEIVGYNNSSVAFEFAILYIKLLKYGLDNEEIARIKILGYEPTERELEIIE